MNRPRSSRVLPIILLASAAVWAAHAADQGGGADAATASGAYALTFQVNAPTTVPDGATVACKAKITPNPSTLERLTGKPAPLESSMGFATVSGSAARCTVQMPLAFRLTDQGNGAVLSYQIDAYTSAGPAFARTQQGIAIAYPKAGSTANLLLDVNL